MKIKKFNLSVIALTFVTGFLLISCTKDDNSQNLAENNLLAKLRMTVIRSTSKDSLSGILSDYSNNDNPYEYVGVNHNKALDYISTYMNNIKDDSQNLSVEIKEPLTNNTFVKVCNGTTDKITALSLKYSNANTLNTYTKEDLNVNSELSTTDKTITYLKANKFADPRLSGLNEFNINYFKKLQYLKENGKINDFETHADSIIVAHVMETDDIVASVQIIKNAENDFLKSDIDSKIKERQLSYLSILRNSIGYWSQVTEDTSNPWWQLNNDFFTRVGTHEGYSKWSWHNFWENLAIGAADGLGGLAGTGLGGIGAVGVGAVASAVVGALYP